MSQSLGKRKEREENETELRKTGSTLFVSNLPYSATSTDINTLFSDIGPVRSAFVVLDQTSGTSKGVGYVSFAIREDAQATLDTVNSAEGLILDGRKLRVEWAGNKPHKEERDKAGKDSPEKEKKPAKHAHVPKPSHPAGPSDPLAIRTIVLSGLPAGIDSKALWKKVRKYDGAEKVEWPVSVNGSEDSSTAHVLFSTPSSAQEAVTRLHAHVFKGALLSVTLKKRLDGLAKPKPASNKPSTSTKKPSADSSQTPAPSRASRLIVRNLPFDTTEQDLRAVFLPYGPIHSIHIPTNEEKDKDKERIKHENEPQPKAEEESAPAAAKHAARGKGYAFVWMLSRKDAEKALEGANGSRVHSGMADSMVRDKQKKKKLRREEAKLKRREMERKARQAGEKNVKAEDDEGEDADESENEGEEEEGEREESEHEGEVKDDSTVTERVIAVDWALSKDKWEEAKAKLEAEVEAEAQADVKEESESGSNGDEEASGSESESDGEDSQLGLHEGSDDESGSDEDEDEDENSGMDVDDEDEENPGKPQLPPPETGTTLFVRNVPFEATDDELRTTFRAFGPLRYARITMDYDMGRSRGTGFVCFWSKEDADKAIEQSELLRQETTGTLASAPKKNPFKLPSLLTPDPSASAAQNLVLHGRTLDVVRAVTRDEAGKLKEEGERQREKNDKRNLYLLREGLILRGTPAADGLNLAELEKRAQSFSARKALLRSNPSLYVSRTRLSIRQIPLFVSERTLKRLAVHAVRAFEAEVKDGAREPLTADELTDPPADPEGGDEKDKRKGKDKDKDNRKDKGKDKMKNKKGRSTGVKQAKVIRQADRIDSVTGKGRSRGYGFLEMEKHADALRVLRWANNNADLGKLFDQWYKEELRGLLEAEKKNPKREEGRLERIKAELEQDAPKKSKGSLTVEFSIENVQVVKRRVTRQQEQRSAPPDQKEKRRSKEVKKEEPQQDGPPHKKRRASDASTVEEKPENKIGSLIGRKRKERREKRKT